jgi:hypothetical protein
MKGFMIGRSYPILVAALLASGLSLCATAASGRPLLVPRPGAEQWVLDQVTAGLVADLDRSGIQDKRIRARLVVALLTGSASGAVIQHQGVDIRHAEISGYTDLRNAHVSYFVSLAYCRFTGHVYLSSARFDRALRLRGSTVTGILADDMRVDSYVNFDSLTVEGTTRMRGATVGGMLFARHAMFGGVVETSYTEIGGNLDLTGAQFDEAAMLNGMHIGGSFFADSTTFGGRANISSARIGETLDVQDAEFGNSAMLYGMQIGGYLFASGATFRGGVDINYTGIGANLEMTGAEFHGAARVYDTRVGGSIYADSAAFRAKMDARYTRIAANLHLIGAQLDSTARLGNIEIGGTLDASGARFGGRVTMTHADIGNLQIAGGRPCIADTGRCDALSLDLSHTVVRGKTELAHLPIRTLVARSLDARGLTHLDSIDVLDSLALEYSSFRGLHLSEVNWPDEVGLDGMTYEHIAATPWRPRQTQSESEELIAFLGAAKFSAQSYSQLEEFFDGQGRRMEATDVLFARKSREESAMSLPPWVWSKLLRYTVGYGRRTRDLLGYIAVFIIAGWAVFRYEHMAYVGPAPVRPPPERYSPFWFSVDAFVPVADLRFAKEWRARGRRAICAYCLRLVGPFLISLGLAAATGIIR